MSVALALLFGAPLASFTEGAVLGVSVYLVSRGIFK